MTEKLSSTIITTTSTTTTFTSTGFNSLKPSSNIVGSLAITGNQKKLQKSNKRRVVPVPVAPPRLPQSASSSTVVTPTGTNKQFMSTSSFDASQQNMLPSEACNNTSATTYSIIDEDQSVDLEQSQLGETKRNRLQQMSKLFSLQSDNKSAIGFDISSISGGITVNDFQDSGGKTDLQIFHLLDSIACDSM